MYALYKFHFLNGISEINQLFDDILIIWPAPVYPYQGAFFNNNKNIQNKTWFYAREHNNLREKGDLSDTICNWFTVIVCGAAQSDQKLVMWYLKWPYFTYFLYSAFFLSLEMSKSWSNVDR